MPQFIEYKGWKLFLHPCFQETYVVLIETVEKLKKKDESWYNHPKAKLLKRIEDLIKSEIPQDPTQDKYRQGNTLGPSYRHWKRAKFLRRFRLFFRYNEEKKVIIYAWVNDENSLRKEGGKKDPYVLFFKKLQTGNPPDSFEDLLKESVD